jgi:hypothetical protein
LQLKVKELEKFRNGTSDPFLGPALRDRSSSQYSISHSSGISGFFFIFYFVFLYLPFGCSPPEKQKIEAFQFCS